ncbi:L-ascorbate oxidase homolog [Olea europaea subsp. europaea]|uniref:L-ascorbate oxidase homolog n=1 Tax=Olea europaea subsp. europaea TaxID=158383 RepID=A0A8S0UUM8_OLEEU|nr:L-ascorbate oxidase homolog [Olea europaea subsp. europaea]
MVHSEDPYLFFTWNIAYGNLSPLGIPTPVILINGQFPGPEINCNSNNNVVFNVFNHLDEPFLFTWNGIQQRKNSWQEGTPGTTCLIPPSAKFTYNFQVAMECSRSTFGRTLRRPEGDIINGKQGKGYGTDKPMFTMIHGKTYRYRVCNVGMKNSINVRIQGHPLKLVEIEGSHTVQNVHEMCNQGSAIHSW